MELKGDWLQISLFKPEKFIAVPSSNIKYVEFESTGGTGGANESTRKK